MSTGLPPPPQRADSGDFAWVAWYNQLYQLLNTSGSVQWSLINKAGSSIADLQNHNHDLLTGIDGTGTYHVTAAEATALNAGATGSFVAGTHTITVTNGIITSIT